MEPYLAQVMMFGGNFAIRGWALCDGQIMSIAANNALFSLLGTTYGGDGRTTFALPDLRGRVAIHPGSGPGLSSYRSGQRGGVEYVILNTTQIPAHSHTAELKVSAGESTVSTAVAGNSISTPGALAGRTFTPTLGFGTAAPTVALNAGSVAGSNTGGSLSHPNIQPFLGINHLIALQGLYPSRN
ncbi:MAG: phage tail protein [Crocinitomicaceae bacterium]|nr:tail fiber protein [Flavobacteriales bacterium]NQZ34614.1 phage tail protein [Crocinitomicaceae bacterium]